MVLADTSVWIDHLRSRNPVLAGYLSQARVLMHPFIAGELACGNLKNRVAILANLNALPVVKSASQDEALGLIDGHKLWGRGLGWIDVHLLASALLTRCRFWTLDRRLAQAARDLGLKA